jgi:hypothetical protein
MKKMMGHDIDDILELAGLERRRNILSMLLPAVGLLAFGAAFGAGVGLMFAPSSGRRFRQDMGDRLDQLRDKMKNEAQKEGVMNATHQ